MMKQLHLGWRTLALTYVLPLAFLLALTFQQQVPMRILTADVPAVTKLPTTVGLVSNLGILGWAASVTICAFAAYLLWKSSRWARFFLALGLMTLLLLLDDMFMIHERVLPNNNIPEEVYFIVYPLLVLFITVRFWRYFRQTNRLLLLSAVGLLAMSMAVDLTYETILDIYHGIQDRSAITAPDSIAAKQMPVETAIKTAAEPVEQDSYVIALDEKTFSLAANFYYLAEDGSKFAGIIGWLCYLASVAQARIKADLT